MNDRRKEISKQIDETARAIQTHRNNISQIERERNDLLREFGNRVYREKGEIDRLQKQLSELKRQLL
jgi:hypothetical protein